QGMHRPDAGIEIQGLAQTDVDRAEALAHGGGARSFESHAITPDQIQGCLGERVAVTVSCGQAGISLDPVDMGAGGLNNCLRCLRHFGPNAVAPNQYNRRRHKSRSTSRLDRRINALAALPKKGVWNSPVSINAGVLSA